MDQQQENNYGTSMDRRAQFSRKVASKDAQELIKSLQLFQKPLQRGLHPGPWNSWALSNFERFLKVDIKSNKQFQGSGKQIA